MKRLLVFIVLLAACKKESAPAPIGNAVNGKLLVQQYGCTSCHDIPDVTGPHGMVGPSLEHLATRPIVAGKLQNTPDNVTNYLQNPQAVDPANAMPNLGLTPEQSRDITAFLYTLK